MEFSEKALARQKFRSSRGRGRAGRGRGGQHRGTAHKPHGLDLDSNSFRYEDDTEQADDGVVPPKSQGADLELLLEDADAQFRQAFYRFRAQLDDITEAAPPMGATQPDQLLAIDLQQLGASLAALPLHALLGLDPCYLEGLQAATNPHVQPPPQPRLQELPLQQLQALQQQHAASPLAAPGAPGQGSGPQAGALAPAVPATAALGASLLPPSQPTVQPQAPGHSIQAVLPARTHQTQEAQPTVPDTSDDHDPELEALLMGQVPARVAAPRAPVAVQPPSQPLQRQGTAGLPASSALPPALAAVMAAARVQAQPPSAATDFQSPVAPPVVVVGAAMSSSGTSDAAVHPVGARPVAAPVAAAVLPGAAAGRAGAPGAHSRQHQPGAVQLGTAAGSASTATPASTPAVQSQPLAVARATLPPARSGASPGTPQQVVPAAAKVPGLPGGGAPGQPREAVGAGGTGVGGGGGGIDEELRLLLGLPAAAAVGGPAPTPKLQPQSQGVPRPGGVKVSTASLPAAKPHSGAPAAHTVAAKSLDDWLDSLKGHVDNKHSCDLAEDWPPPPETGR